MYIYICIYIQHSLRSHFGSSQTRTPFLKLGFARMVVHMVADRKQRWRKTAWHTRSQVLLLYIYIYVNIYINTYTYISIHLFIYAYMHTFTFIHMYMYACIHIYLCVQTGQPVKTADQDILMYIYIYESM